MNNLPALRRALLRWFSRSKRPLPWRRTRDPYAIWVSESMLQQTTVAAVIPYYERFMKRFPDVASLAASREEDVLALWSGLGYYSRARNLRRAASQLLDAHEGCFPRTVDAAVKLPGVGRYTASAVTSIAYGTPTAVVDGNVRRVLSRLCAIRDLRESQAQEKAQTLLSTRSAGSWNEAMMELGATICTPKRPRCEECPVRAHCLGRSRPEHWSEGKPRRESVATVVEMALIARGTQILLVRNPDQRLMSGLFELPNGGIPGPGELTARYPRLRTLSEPLAAFRHTITHHRIEARVFKAKLSGRGVLPGASFHSIAGLNDLPLGGLTRKALRALGLLPL